MKILIETDENMPLPIAGIVNDIKETLKPYSKDAKDLGYMIKFSIKYLHYEDIIE